MPTSRYCDQRPAPISTHFERFAASGEPGCDWAISPPSTAGEFGAQPLGGAGSPLARSSITRSIRLSAKVTPAALMA